MTVDHVVLPLRADHLAAVAALAEGLATATGVASEPRTSPPHVTLIAFTNLDRTRAVEAVSAAVHGAAPLVLHAHGYGFFTGDEARDLSVHVPVVRDRALDEVHRAVHRSLRLAGACIADWTGPDLWSPHITLVDRGLEPATIAAGVAWLARRHHPSWHIPVDRLVVTGGWSERDRAGTEVLLGPGPRPQPFASGSQ